MTVLLFPQPVIFFGAFRLPASMFSITPFCTCPLSQGRHSRSFFSPCGGTFCESVPGVYAAADSLHCSAGRAVSFSTSLLDLRPGFLLLFSFFFEDVEMPLLIVLVSQSRFFFPHLSPVSRSVFPHHSRPPLEQIAHAWSIFCIYFVPFKPG